MRMDSDELNSLIADTRVALAGGATAEDLSTALVSLLRTARDDGKTFEIPLRASPPLQRCLARQSRH